MTAETGPLGLVTRYGYDALGRLASVTGPDGAVTFVLCCGGRGHLSSR